MRNLSAIVLILMLVVASSCKYFKGGKEDNAASVLMAKQDSIRVADSIRKVQEQLIAIENGKLDSARKTEEERLALESKYKYNIIVGSFITPEYADRLADSFQKKGYNPKILKVAGSRFELVSAEGHDSFRKAVARLKEFQDTIESEAWMYIKK